MDPELSVRLLREGMDGILVLGCHPGDCHYLEGNYFAEIKMEWTRELLSKTDFDADRLMLDWVSASEDQRFASIVGGFQQRIRELGPNPINDEGSTDLRDQLDAALLTLKDFRLRALMGKVRTIRVEGNVYGEVVKQSELDALVASAVESEYLRNYILVLADQDEWTVMDLADRLGRSPEEVMTQVVRLRQKNLLGLAKIDGHDPYYKAIGGV
jgi:hypothetical protein